MPYIKLNIILEFGRVSSIFVFIPAGKTIGRGAGGGGIIPNPQYAFIQYCIFVLHVGPLFNIPFNVLISLM